MSGVEVAVKAGAEVEGRGVAAEGTRRPLPEAIGPPPPLVVEEEMGGTSSKSEEPAMSTSYP